MKRGFIALISVVLIAAFLLATVLSTGMRAYYTRLSLVLREEKEYARSLARGCIEVARLVLLEEPEYGGGTFALFDASCELAVGSRRGSVVTVTVAIPYRAVRVAYQADVDAFTGIATNIREIPSPLR